MILSRSWLTKRRNCPKTRCMGGPGFGRAEPVNVHTKQQQYNDRKQTNPPLLSLSPPRAGQLFIRNRGEDDSQTEANGVATVLVRL